MFSRFFKQIAGSLLQIYVLGLESQQAIIKIKDRLLTFI
jgi:hypothetical protein